tara:strand:+ start:19493 stop:20179 length:687 start_codon:yes stop_codon:yes gene_type:complete
MNSLQFPGQEVAKFNYQHDRLIIDVNCFGLVGVSSPLSPDLLHQATLAKNQDLRDDLIRLNDQVYDVLVRFSCLNNKVQAYERTNYRRNLPYLALQLKSVFAPWSFVIEDSRGEWLALTEQHSLGYHCRLNDTAMLGQRYYHPQQGLHITLGPMSLDDFLQLNNDPKRWQRCHDELLTFSPKPPHCKFTLLVIPSACSLQLGNQPIYLGWHCWLGRTINKSMEIKYHY